MISTLIFTFTSSFMALFPVANPIGISFILNGLLSDYSREDQLSMIKKIVFYYLIVGIGSLIIGRFILMMFSLSLPIVQMGGGFLICKTALGWLSDSQPSPQHKTENITNNIDNASSQLFYPMTFPVSIGPGTMSVIFTLTAASTYEAAKWYETILNYGVIALAIALMALILYFFVTKGQVLMRKLGKSGTQVINKLVAFFTFCVGIQILFEGLNKLFNLHISF